MSYGLKVLGVAGTVVRPNVDDIEGKWVAEFDPDAHDGMGVSELTDDPDEALRFDSSGDALAFWQQTSTVRPTRPDGRPNRPLTAFTVSVEQIPDE